MQSFIVLGIIPGTDIQTNLNFWIGVAAILAVFSLRRQIVAGRDLLRKYADIRRMLTAFERYEFSVIG